MVLTRKSPVIASEEFEAKVNSLFSLVSELADALRPASEEEVAGSEFNFDDRLKADLKDFLEDELTPAIPVKGGSLDAVEVDHEIAKKALVGMKTSALREALRDRDLPAPSRASAEELAEIMARSFDWNAEEVARFVLQHEEEPSVNRGHAVRLFRMADNVALDEVAERLAAVMGRYVRIGVAKWFVFNDCRRGADSLKIWGSYMAYGAKVDDVDGRPELVPIPQSTRTVVELGSDGLLSVDDSTVQAARAAVHAVAAVGSIALYDYVPNSGSGADSVKGVVHGASEFFLDIIHNRMRDSLMSQINLTVARFKIAPGDIDDELHARPVIRAIRFEGAHILDSAEACRLLAQDGRPLANVAMRVTVPSRAGTGSAVFPIKLSLDKDHAMVTTGLGTEPESSLDLHQSVVEAVAAEITEGRSDSESLAALVKRISARAKDTTPPDKASILSE